MFLLLKLLYLSTVTYLASCSCTFPSALQHDWESSSKGAFTINSTHLSGYEVYTYTDLNFQCDTKLSNYYILRSDENITILGADTNALICLKFVEVSTDKYLYYELTSELSDADNERMQFVQYGSSVSINSGCDDLSIEDTIQEAKLMIKNGSASSERTQCPDDILGYYNYSATNCTDGIWDVCDDNENMQFTYSDCNETQAYSDGGSVYCVYTEQTSDGDDLVYVYNADSSVDDNTTFTFTCMVLNKSDSGEVNVTQNAMECYGNQTSSYVPGGSVTTLTADYTCVPTDAVEKAEEETTASAGLIAGLVILFVLLIVVGVAAGIFIYIKKFKKVDPRVIDGEKEVGYEKERQLDAVTPSVVKAEMDTSRGGGTHGKLAQVLGPEYTMSNATDENKASANEQSTNLDQEPLESARKLPPIETGNTPRESFSPMDTQLQKATLPAIS